MEPLMNSLNEQQKEAALCIDQHVRIVAGAGSGKTRVLMARIEYLLNELGVYPGRILAITFTNKATREMKERLQAQVGDVASRVRVSTIHSLCVRILREDGTLLGYPRDFMILDTDDQKAILKKIYKEFDYRLTDYPIGQAMGKISLWNRRQIHPQTCLDQAQGRDNRVWANIYSQYVKKKQELRAMDFDDLLLNGEALLRLFDEVREKWQNRLDYLHVDEFQDIDPVQYSLIRSLVRKDAILAVVGDPDQTIYTWRGANVDIIMNFEQDFQPSRTVLLTQNYRSSEKILQASNGLIACNRNRVEKDLTSTHEGGEPVMIFKAPDEESEARMAVSMLENLNTDGIEWKDIAILYRSNYISRNYEKALRIAGIPYRIYGGIRFYERAEIKDLLSYLRLISEPSPDDPLRLSLNLPVERVANVPRRGMGPKFFQQLNEEATQRGINLLEVMRDPQTLSAASAKKALGFAQLIDQLRQDLRDDGLENIIEHILDRTGYRAMLNASDEEGRLENALELQTDIDAAMRDNPDLTLEQYLQEVSLFTDADQEDGQNAVTLMTVHAAKGTEFDTVFIGSVNEEVFPSGRAMSESGLTGLEEERRLMYVAMTRAKSHLFISWNQGYSYQSGHSKTPSRFLKEIPDQYTNQRAKKETKNAASPKPVLKASRRKLSGVLRPGSSVYHKVFGNGLVLEVSGSVVTVLFEKTKTKKKIARDYLELAK